MKKIFFLSSFFVIALFSFSQAQQTAKISSLEAYNNNKFKDTFTFELSEKMTKEKVAEMSNYYTAYFTTTFNEKDNTISVKMMNQEWKNRQIMRRLFSGLQIENVIVEGNQMSTDEFFKEYVLTTDQQPSK
jgi:hypothetical protein